MLREALDLILFYFHTLNGLCLPTSEGRYKMYWIQLQVASVENNFLEEPSFPVVFFWNCSAYVETCTIIYSIESCATAVPDVSNLD